MHTTRFVLAFAASAAALTAAPAAAQSILLPSAPEKGIALEATYTDFKVADVSAPSSVWFLSGRLPLTPQLRVFGDLPFAYGNMKLDIDGLGIIEDKDAVFGNPRLGMEFLANPALTLEGSVRLPLTSANETTVADITAIMADPQRGEAFLKDVVPVSAAVNYEQVIAPGVSLRARAGGTRLFYTGDDDRDNATLADYGLFGSYATGPARLGLGLSGRWNVSEDDGSFSENSLHWLGLTADAAVRGVRPGISFRMPLDKDHRELVGPSVGLYLQVPLR
jgi:hypothetical protein